MPKLPRGAFRVEVLSTGTHVEVRVEFKGRSYGRAYPLDRLREGDFRESTLFRPECRPEPEAIPCD